MKIGRNDPCPCGSGKKYKQCCLLKESKSVPTLIREAVEEAGYKEDFTEVLCNLYSYMQKMQWWGACHASCSALYVALSELGYNPTICIGEVIGPNLYFDHSWLKLDGEILDMAICMTLLGGAAISDPVLFGKDIRTGTPPILKYGVPGRGIEGESLIVTELPFDVYMDKFPNEKDGLWGVVRKLLGHDINIDELRKKYHEVKREIIRED